MSDSPPPRARPDYGIDAPPILRNLLVIAGLALVLAVVLHVLDLASPARIPLRDTALVTAVLCFLNAAGMIYYSKVGKLRSREGFLDLVPWKGDERVLDVGCGRGLLLIGAAKRLTTGKAVGVDLWQAEDLSGNRPEATLENARREGVLDRVEVKDGDASALPFPDASFDVVISGLVLHNIYDREKRQQALREVARVLKPGGHVAIIDIEHAREYERILRENGVTDARRTTSGLLAWLIMIFTWGSVQPARVTGRKAGP